MRLRLMIEGQERVSWADWVALGAVCEAEGIEGLFRSDHYLAFLGESGDVLDAWGTICGLAAITDRIRLGTLVSPVTFRTATSLAKLVATADHVSGGRVELGIGAGWYEAEHDAHGLRFPPLASRLRLLEEQLGEINRQWETLPPTPIQRPRPPILMGGSAGSQSLRLAIRFADEYNCALVTPERCREVRQILDDLGGSHLRLSAMTPCIVGADDAEVARRLTAFRERYGSDDALAQSIVGTVEEICGALKEYADAGCAVVYLQHLLPQDMDMVRVIGREIVATVESFGGQ